jgi:hypothetical protein
LSRGARVALAGGMALVATLLLGALSRQPLQWESPDDAAVRLTWRLRGAEVESCVRPTPEELERLSPHMRNPDACTGRMPEFRLTVSVDDRMIREEEVSGAGARGDRPIYVFRELRVPPGNRALRVDFVAEGEGVEGLRELRLDTLVVLEPGEVVLVTHDAGMGEALGLRTPR